MKYKIIRLSRFNFEFNMNYLLSIIKVLCLEKIANRYIMIDIISISNCLFVYF